MISLRLPSEIESKLDAIARSKGMTRTDVLKDSILEYFQNHSMESTPFLLGEDLFGKFHSGNPSLALNRKKLIKAHVTRKHAR